LIPSRLILFLLVVVLTIASSHVAFANAQQQRADLKNRYDIIEVTQFTVEQGVTLPAEYMQSMMDGILKDLRRTKKFKYVLAPGDAKQKDSSRAIQLLGTVTQYKHGSRGKRLVAIGLAGDTKLVAHVKFVDKTTGEVLVEADVDGQIYTGLLGGSPRGAPTGIGKDVAKIAKKVFF
jgi:hypothetical protein